MIDLTDSPLTTTTARGQRLTVPRVHSGGDAGTVLLDEHLEMLSAVRNAERILHLHAPNQRNFYLDDRHGAFTQAVAEHDARVQLLRLVAEDLTALAEAVQAQNDRRDIARRAW